MFIVDVTLLSTLSNLEPAPDLLDLLYDLEYYLRTPYDPLTNLTPID